MLGNKGANSILKLKLPIISQYGIRQFWKSFSSNKDALNFQYPDILALSLFNCDIDKSIVMIFKQLKTWTI